MHRLPSYVAAPHEQMYCVYTILYSHYKILVIRKNIELESDTGQQVKKYFEF